MSDEQKSNETPVPCPFCGEEWELFAGNLRNHWSHPDNECPTLWMIKWNITQSDLPRYNAACAKMRERVLRANTCASCAWRGAYGECYKILDVVRVSCDCEGPESVSVPDAFCCSCYSQKETGSNQGEEKDGGG